MRRLNTIVALALAACATVGTPTSVHLVRGDTPVEQQILRSYQTYASVNASVGSADIIYSTDRVANLSRYEAIIHERMQRDLSEIYPAPLQSAERVYLLLGSQSGRDVVEVIRLGAADPERPNRQSFDGLYSVGPLTYIFDPASLAVLGVSGPVAGEY